MLLGACLRNNGVGVLLGERAEDLEDERCRHEAFERVEFGAAKAR